MVDVLVLINLLNEDLLVLQFRVWIGTHPPVHRARENEVTGRVVCAVGEFRHALANIDVIV